jgi:hypothetical protein
MHMCITEFIEWEGTGFGIEHTQYKNVKYFGITN